MAGSYEQPDLPLSEVESVYQPTLPGMSELVQPTGHIVRLPPYRPENDIHIEPLGVIRVRGPEYALRYTNMIWHIGKRGAYSVFSDAQVAVLAGCTTEEIQQQADQGILPRNGHGSFDPKVAIAHALYPGIGIFFKR